MPKERHSVRSKSLLKATIRFPNRQVILGCVVRDISSSGAKLELDPTFVLPSEFELDVPQRRTIFPCELAWRRGNAVGVRFKSDLGR
ncbi:MAG: PilZ domain-containing protein [Alphaproteobacteria bacterium]|nr:PilZ domain-containing protein [Alphaproteobacteria bacterium]